MAFPLIRKEIYMKKLYPAIAVLMALAVSSCDFAPLSKGSEPIEYTEDGRPLVNLTIGRPNMSRALTLELARRGVDFYEVAFTDGTKVYRASWDYTQTGKIKVPAGDYGGANKAVLFAGRYSDMTLLAVARITMVDTTPVTYTAGVGTANITATTTSVTFTLTPLLTDVHGGVQGAAGAPTNSSFLITGPAGYITTGNHSATELPDAKVGDKTIPIFKIPNNAAATASFGLSLSGGGAVFAEYNTAIQALAGGTVKFAGVSANNYPPVLLDPDDTKITAPDPTAPATIALPAAITIDLVSAHNDGTDNGLCKIAISVPVVALGTTEFPHTWNVRGGLNNGDYDLGADEPLKGGGAILLGVGNISDDGIDIIIN
jgi:hypothetical protein